ncbi:MAG TPA: DUF192 domain-containing protein [Balneolaceae bacterium]|nr:DUF192 domain-containing protein [Balneolaceae bacterium]
MKTKKSYFQLLLLVLMVLTVLLNGCSSDKNKNTEKDNNKKRTISFTEPLAFIDTDGDTVATISVAIADTPAKRSLGLMNYTDLQNDQGMLFIFQEEKPLSFWMANTPLSLDIMFVNADKKIVRIHHSTPPFSKRNFTSDKKPALYAVETNAGFAISHDIREGMKVSF